MASIASDKQVKKYLKGNGIKDVPFRIVCEPETQTMEIKRKHKQME
jgi:hypothetical protein